MNRRRGGERLPWPGAGVIVVVMEPPHRTAHREDIPSWGWVALGLMRLWALLPLAVLVAGIWWWTHGGARQAPRLLKQAVQHVRAAVDSGVGR